MFLKQISSNKEYSSIAGADSIEVLTIDMIQGRVYIYAIDHLFSNRSRI